jgi:dTMP kinase
MMSQARGGFITFEGPEGSGKTTQIQALAAFLRGAGYPVMSTREPGGTRIGDAVRQVLLDMTHTEMDARTETLLFNAARAQIVEQVIRPALAQGSFVLCDRFADSTLAYQGYGHGQDLDALGQLIRYATGGLTPDLTLYLDINPDIGLTRKQQASQEEWNRLDAQTLAFHERVYAGYQALIQADPARWAVVNGGADPQTVAAEIVAVVASRFAIPTANPTASHSATLTQEKAP